MSALALPKRIWTRQNALRAAVLHWWLSNVWATGFPLIVGSESHSAHFGESSPKFFLFLAAAVSRRRDAPWKAQLQWPVWWNALRVFLPERGEFLHVQTHRPGSTALYLAACPSEIF